MPDSQNSSPKLDIELNFAASLYRTHHHNDDGEVELLSTGKNVSSSTSTTPESQSIYLNPPTIPQTVENSEPIPLIDSSTPTHTRVLKTAQDIAYGLVFSDKFTQNRRSFSAGTFLLPSATINFLSFISFDHDLIWEAASSIDSGVYDLHR